MVKREERKMTAITRYVTVGLALFESIAMTIGFSRGNIVKDMKFLKAVVVIAALQQVLQC